MNGPFSLPGDGPIQRFETQESRGFLPRGAIDGLTLSNDTTDATNDIGIAAGSAKSTVHVVDGTPSTLTRDQIDLELPINIIKQLDTPLAPDSYDPEGFSGGDRSGGRSSSSLSNTTWHGCLVGGRGMKPDVFFHDSATQSSVLAEMMKIGGYTAYRRIGSVLRESAALVGFTQNGDEFLRNVLTLDINTTNPGTLAALRTLKVPVGIKVGAIVDFGLNRGSAGTNIWGLLTSPDETDSTPTNVLHDLHVQTNLDIDQWVFSRRVVRTNTAAQIRSRQDASATNNGIRIFTRGWWDQRDRNA